MPIPDPYDSEAGRRSFADDARQIGLQITWISRLTKEILAAPDLTLKRAAQLNFHCRTLRTLLDNHRDGSSDLDGIRETLRQWVYESSGIDITGAELNTLLKSLYAEAGTYATFVDSGFPQTDGKPVAYYVVINPIDGRLLESDIVVSPIPAAFTTRVQALRDLFV